MISTLRKRNVGNSELKNHQSLLHRTNKYNVVNQLQDCTDLPVTQPQDDPEQNKDLISQLSDDILIKILGYIDTSCATSTSILSTRWRNLHKQIPNIDLNCSDLLRHIPAVHIGSSNLSETSWTNLHKVVSNIEWGIGNLLGWNHAYQTRHNSDLVVGLLDRFLSLRSGSKIHSVRLDCCLNKSVSTRFDQCIYYLGKLGVEKLVLQCCCRELNPDVLYFSSQNLLNMPSLKYLELGCCYLMPSLRSQCNSLQNLVLSAVTLPRGALEGILSNCSSLHSLTIEACNIWSSRLTIRGPNLQLKYLNIRACPEIDEIELCASNLVVFKFTNYKMVDFIFDHVPQLQSVYLHTHHEDIRDYVSGKLANDLPHLKSLQFVNAGDCFHGRSAVIDGFSNLRRLDLTLSPILGINDLLVLTPLLQSCPLLQEFHLSTLLSEHDRPPQGKKQGIVFHSELKKMEISGFVGTENDIEFALYILKSAIKLEEMHITPCQKERVGFGRRNLVYEQGLWSEESQRMILTRLQGQAISLTARLFLQHKHQIVSAIELDCEDDFLS